MRIVKARSMGFCMGVKRAVDMALANSGSGKALYSLGPLIHNDSVLASLAERGLRVLNERELGAVDLEGATVLIRAHGVAPDVRARLEAKGARILDATCPKVIASQRKALAASEKGMAVLIAGDKDHGEVRGIAGHARGALILSSAEEAAASLPPAPGAKALLLAQTTFDRAEYLCIEGALGGAGWDLETVDSICEATKDRRAALEELLSGPDPVDGVVIVGGRDSANARRLFEAAAASGKPAWFVEGAGELPEEAARCAVLGLAAGASTPDWEIEAVEKKLREMAAEEEGK